MHIQEFKTPKTIADLVDMLIAKVQAWELEKGMPFLYNKVMQLYVYYILHPITSWVTSSLLVCKGSSTAHIG